MYFMTFYFIMGSSKKMEKSRAKARKYWDKRRLSSAPTGQPIYTDPVETTASTIHERKSTSPKKLQMGSSLIETSTDIDISECYVFSNAHIIRSMSQL